MTNLFIANVSTAKTPYLETEGGRIAYTIEGTGPLVICVPSMGDLRQEYRYLVPQLVEAGYTAVAMDVRGHGESSTGWADYSVAGVGRDIISLIRHLDRGPAFVVGTSMAAGAAVYAAAEAPEQVAGLVAIGPFVRDIPVPGYMNLLYKLLFGVALRKPWGPSAWAKYYRSLYPSTPPADLLQYVDTLKANLTEPGRLAALRGMMFASKAASGDRLDRVQAPALVIMGSKDPDFKDPRAEAELVANRLHGELRMLDGAGHYPHAEMPAVTGPAIIEFLDRVRARTPDTEKQAVAR
jgi:pimeloyl-ACP methyl ester carboxylesterase